MAYKRSRRIAPAIEGASGVDFRPVFIPLCLVLLAFFILLNSISQREKQKEAEAMGSLHKTFDPSPEEKKKELGLFQIINNPLPKYNFLAPIAKLSQPYFKQVSAEIIDNEERVQIRTPVKDFFDEGATIVSKTQKDFLTSLAKELSALNKITDVRIELLFGSAAFTKEPDALLQELYRAGSLARTLSELGVPERNIIVGVSNEYPAEIIMNFYNAGL